MNTSFEALGLTPRILQALAEEGYSTPTPIQAQAIPPALEGRDLLGIAQTGTGKTAAFALPLLQRLAAKPLRTPRGGCRVLVLSPTRELATQIADSFRAYGRHLGFTVAVVFGGVGFEAQRQTLARGVDVLVATPGRLQDHLDQGTGRIDTIEALVLDEADQMLDKGFLPAIRRLLRAVPAVRQTLFFSATMPTEIDRLAGEILKSPVRVAVAPVATTAEKVAQRVIHVDRAEKRRVLADLLRADGVGRTLVFSRTKHGANRIVKQLDEDGIRANAIHGNKAQNARERALAAFRDGSAPVLVATDIAARGIDVDGITHVVQFDLPEVPETYVHRIGRTARAGATGEAIALCSPDDRDKLRAIERLIRAAVPIDDRRDARARSVRSTDGTMGSQPAVRTPTAANVAPRAARPFEGVDGRAAAAHRTGTPAAPMHAPAPPPARRSSPSVRHAGPTTATAAGDPAARRRRRRRGRGGRSAGPGGGSGPTGQGGTNGGAPGGRGGTGGFGPN